MDFTKIDELVLSMKDDLIRDIQRWVAIPSVQGEPAEGAPFGKEVRRMLDLALSDAKKYGFEVRDIDGYAGDISFGSGEQTMGMLCHLDVVPLGDGWVHDPLGGEIEDGKIYGRGAIDDKGPALCALYAMRAVRDAGVPLKDGVRLILGCDEETGMSDMRYYASKMDMPDYGFSPDAEFPVINIEKGGLNLSLEAEAAPDGSDLSVVSIFAGERINVVPGVAKAVLKAADPAAVREKVARIAEAHGFALTVQDAPDGCVELTAEGVAAHASMPHLGKNAAGMLLIALKELGAGGALRGAIQALADKVGMEYDGASLGIRQADELSGPLTCNLGLLRCDGGRIQACLDIRYPLCADEADMLACASEAVKGALKVSNIGSHTPLHVPAEHKIVRGLLKVYTDVTGLEGKALAIGGGTYSRMMPNTVAFGINFPGDQDMCHMPDEYIDIEKMMLGVKIFAHAIALLAGGEIQ